MFTIIVIISLPIIYLVKLKMTWPSECLKSPDFPLNYLPAYNHWARSVSKLSVWHFDGIFPKVFLVFFCSLMLLVSVFMKKLILKKEKAADDSIMQRIR